MTKDMAESGFALDNYLNVRMVHPRRTMAIEVPLRNKIAAYLATNYEISRDQALASLPAELTLWGKMKQLSGGDLIHAWDLVSAYHTSRDSVRDATFIKYTLEIDRNMNFRNLPVVLERKAFFGQVRKFVVIMVPPDFPARCGATEAERAELLQSGRERAIVLAVVTEAKLVRKNALGMVYFEAKSSDLGPATEVIDVESIDCLAGRVWDSKRWACIVRPEVTAKFKLIEESVIGEVDEG
ncbi:hypothetical protein C8J57DRAFT_1179829 [Mycena rebaudengoi]|nr:hypothetical protein C8J57DRAFT_1179829 [Mycena rebaudengoi]